MTTLKFGVFTFNVIREYVTGVLNSVHHYEGQLVISDGKYSGVVDPYYSHLQEISIQSFYQTIKMKESLKETHKDWEAIFLADPSADMPNFSLEDIFFFENKSELPITWFDTYNEALAASKPMPDKCTIASSTQLTPAVLKRHGLNHKLPLGV